MQDGPERWRSWEELVHLLWMALHSYNKTMKGEALVHDGATAMLKEKKQGDHGHSETSLRRPGFLFLSFPEAFVFHCVLGAAGGVTQVLRLKQAAQVLRLTRGAELEASNRRRVLGFPVTLGRIKMYLHCQVLVK